LLMSRAYDPWRDVDGVHIADRCRVTQIAVAKLHGALPARLHQSGVIIGRGTNRVNVRFDGQSTVVSVRSHLVRITAPASTGGG
jgi:hypothetical protein